MSEVNKLHNIDRANQYFGVNMQKILKVFVRKNFTHEEINQVYLSLDDLQELSTFSPPTTPAMSPSTIPSETPPFFSNQLQRRSDKLQGTKTEKSDDL